MDLKKKKVLVIDNVKANRSGLVSILKDTYQIFEGEGAADALALLEKHEKDTAAILINISTPGTEGLQVLEYMKCSSLMEHIPAIMIADHATITQDNMEKGYSLGAMEMVDPPFHSSSLIKRIENLTRIKNHNHETALLKIEANTDPLTKLLNRRGLEREIKVQLSKIQSGKAALCLLDIDNFKQFNDQYGHTFGDEALIRVSEELLRVIREKGIVGRVGGDEFVIFLNCIHLVEDALKKMQEICDIFMEKYSEINISSSIGIAVCPDDGSEYRILFDKADKSLYQAKNAGKNCCIAYDKSFRVMPFRSSVSEVESN